MSYSEKIKDYRKQAGLSQAEMAELIGISQAAYGKIESGFTKSISIDVGKKISYALNIPFGELFEIKGNNNNTAEFEKHIKELQEKITVLEKHITEKDMLIEMFKNEKVRIRKDLLHFLEEIHDYNTYYLQEMRSRIGLKDWQISEIQQTMVNLITTISTSYFMNVGLINEEDWNKVTGKYIGKVRPAGPQKEDEN